jgi:hypothetical protein
VVESGERRALRLAAGYEAAEAVQGGEAVEPRPGADGGPTVRLDEGDYSGASIALEVERDAGMTEVPRARCLRPGQPRGGRRRREDTGRPYSVAAMQPGTCHDDDGTHPDREHNHRNLHGMGQPLKTQR